MIDVQNVKKWLSKNAILEIDLETTGLSYEDDEIVEIAYTIKKGANILAERELKIKPFKFEKKSFDDKRKLKEILGYDIMIEKEKPEWITPSKACEIIVIDFKQVETDTKMYVLGYNVEFDINFLINFFKKYSDYENSIFNFIHPERKIDVMCLLPFIEMTLNTKFQYYKLEYIRKVFKIEGADHNSKEDIVATKKLYKSFFEKLFLK